jgi:glucose-6-phosphate 1-dehydrogenase
MKASHSDALVLFGVTGDLAHKMIFPALYAIGVADGLTPMPGQLFLVADLTSSVNPDHV